MTSEENALEFIPGRLYYVALKKKPKKQSQSVHFCIDEDLVYWNFFLDFGPLNLGQCYRFYELMHKILNDPKLKNKTIYYYSSTNGKNRANAAYLICSYMMIYSNLTPGEAYLPFKNTSFPPFHDATPFECTYKLTVMDCLNGLHRAMRLGFFEMDSFDIADYEFNERVECGDMSWIVKDKFLAFAGPHDIRSETKEGVINLTPEDYIPYFKKKGVTLVIRLNDKKYDKRKFTKAGIKHLDLYYPDGTNPPQHILQQFIQVCESEPGAIAVHCKAGLGRTGTCIDCYMMKHHGFTAAEAIGWTRVCRPGSVIGPQQQFLEYMHPMLKQKSKFDDDDSSSSDVEEKEELNEHEHKTQGDFLRSRKNLASMSIH